jgi:hypothetical protein
MDKKDLIQTMDIAVLIPIKSTPDMNTFKHTDLYNFFFKSFFKYYNWEHRYTIYLGYQEDDKLYSNIKEQEDIKRHFDAMKNADVYMYPFPDKYKGNVVHIWNSLFDKAMMGNGGHNSYFLQCGSDIHFTNENFINDAIKVLKENKDIGVVGLQDKGRLQINPDDKLITQSIVSWKHYWIFNEYFPVELRNYGCDDWLTEIYEKENLVYRLNQGFFNLGGVPRYSIDQKYKQKIKFCLDKYKNHIKNYISFQEQLSNLNGSQGVSHYIQE